MLHAVANFRVFLPTLLVLLGLPSASGSQTNGISMPQLLRVSHLLGKTVETRDGQEVGTLRNLLIDPHAGKTRFAVLAPDGIIAARTRLRIVPPELMSATTSKRDVLALNVIQPAWEEAPTFKSSELLSPDSVGRAREVIEYFETVNRKVGSEMAADAAMKKPRLTPTVPGKSRAKPVEPWLATDFMGRSILSPKREKLGEVLDLILAFDPDSPVLVLMRSERMPDNRVPVYVVPLKAFKQESEKFVLDVTPASLAEARWFDPDGWTTSASSGKTPQVFRYALPGMRLF